MKIEKCEPGYIAWSKKINILWLLGNILIAIAIFLVGYLWMHTRANIFTVLAVLMVLPAAKRVVALVVMLPKKGMKPERYREMKELAGDDVLFADYVFTSTEKIMHLDFLLIRQGNVLAVKASSAQDVEYMKKYLEDNVHKLAPDYGVRVFDRDEELREALDSLTPVEAFGDREEKLVEHLRSLAV